MHDFAKTMALRSLPGTVGAQGISVNGQVVLLPTEFERAGVQDAIVVKGEGQHAVDVTLNNEGAANFHTLTRQAVEAGTTALLVIKIGDTVRGAPAVLEAMIGNQVQISIAPDDNAQKVVDLIREEG